MPTWRHMTHVVGSHYCCCDDNCFSWMIYCVRNNDDKWYYCHLTIIIYHWYKDSIIMKGKAEADMWGWYDYMNLPDWWGFGQNTLQQKLPSAEFRRRKDMVMFYRWVVWWVFNRTCCTFRVEVRRLGFRSWSSILLEQSITTYRCRICTETCQRWSLVIGL